MKKIITLISTVALVVLGAMTTSCNKMERVNGSRVNSDGSITYTITANMPVTKALADGGTTLQKTFAVGEKIKLTYDGGLTIESEALKAEDLKSENHAAIFTFNFGSAPTLSAGSAITYEYPAAYDGLDGQDGTFEKIASTYDYAKWMGTVESDGALPNNKVLANQLAIVKFTLEDKVKNDVTNTITAMTVTDGTNTYSISPSSALSAIWVAMKPVDDKAISVSATDGTNGYWKTASSKTLTAGLFYRINVSMTDSNVIDLGTLSGNCTAQDGDIMTGTLAGNYQISIAADATVILDGARINANGTWTTGNYAGITCNGNATIILRGTNSVKGFNRDYPGVYVPESYTLTIQGSGSLTASSNGWGAGIGGGYAISCGNIVINGGSSIEATGGSEAAGIGGGGNYGGGGNCGDITISGGNITANGGVRGAGIGTGYDNTCGNITISGGSITATSGTSGAGIGTGSEGTCLNITISGGSITANGRGSGAGIGTGYRGHCGNITINNTVTSVTATKGLEATNSIGAGYSGACSKVTIGGTEFWGPKEGDPSKYEYKNGGDTYLPTSPLVYPAP